VRRVDTLKTTVLRLLFVGAFFLSSSNLFAQSSEIFDEKEIGDIQLRFERTSQTPILDEATKKIQIEDMSFWLSILEAIIEKPASVNTGERAKTLRNKILDYAKEALNITPEEIEKKASKKRVPPMQNNRKGIKVSTTKTTVPAFVGATPNSIHSKGAFELPDNSRFDINNSRAYVTFFKGKKPTLTTAGDLLSEDEFDVVRERFEQNDLNSAFAEFAKRPIVWVTFPSTWTDDTARYYLYALDEPLLVTNNDAQVFGDIHILGGLLPKATVLAYLHMEDLEGHPNKSIRQILSSHDKEIDDEDSLVGKKVKPANESGLWMRGSNGTPDIYFFKRDEKLPNLIEKGDIEIYIKKSGRFTPQEIQDRKNFHRIAFISSDEIAKHPTDWTPEKLLKFASIVYPELTDRTRCPQILKRFAAAQPKK
jgi:hypothetical protein